MSGRIPDRFVRFPVNFQDWEYLTFLHWAYDPAVVQALVPAGLTVQQWDGLTWVGITPFQMARVRAPLHIPIPGWGGLSRAQCSGLCANRRRARRDLVSRDGRAASVVCCCCRKSGATVSTVCCQHVRRRVSVGVPLWHTARVAIARRRVVPGVGHSGGAATRRGADASGRECDRPMDGVSSTRRNAVGNTGLSRTVAAAHCDNYR